MAINTTTLSAAITEYATQFTVASTTNITAPVSTTGSGVTLLYIDAELMYVTGVPASGVVQVIRGYGGTLAQAHAVTAGITIGLVSDFPQFTPQIAAFQTLTPNRFQGVSAPVAAAATITATGPIFHVTGTTQTTTINPPSNFVEGQITVIADSAWSWSTTSAAFGIAVAGTATTAPGTVTFTYDSAKGQWYPSRVV